MERKTAEMMCAGGCGKMADAGEGLCRECREQLLGGEAVWVDVSGKSKFDDALKRIQEVRQ